MTMNKKSKWKRRIAIALTMCMLINEQVAGLPLTMKAVAEESVSSEKQDASEAAITNEEEYKTETVTKSEAETKTNQEEEVLSKTEPKTEAVSGTEEETEAKSEAVSEIEEETEAKSEAVSEIEEETEAKSETISEIEEETETKSEAVSETEEETENKSEAVSGTEEETEAKSEAVSEIEEETETKSEEVSETEEETETKSEAVSETEEETETKSEAVSEIEEETETEKLTEIETEQETEALLVIEEDVTDVLQSDGANTGLPGTVEDYIKARDGYTADDNTEVAGRTDFYIYDEQDFLDAQYLCEFQEVQGFKDITLIISGVEGGTWQLENIGDFTGIGSEEYPFQGTLKCHYENGQGTKVKVNIPIIKYLAEGATITQLDIVSNNSSAVIAENIVSGTEEGKKVTINDVWISGIVANDDGKAGMVAENIASGVDLCLDSVDVNDGLTLSGDIVGGIAATVSDDVNISIMKDSVLKSFDIDGATAAGGIAGTAGKNLSININDTANVDAFTISGGSVGGIAGITGSNAAIAVGENAYFYSNSQTVITGSVAVGGHFGVCTGSQTWNLAEEARFNIAVKGNANACYMGQFAGEIKAEGVDRETLNVAGGTGINANINGTGSAGGFVGILGENVDIEKPEGKFTINGIIKGNYAHSGGIAGVMVNPYMVMSDYALDGVQIQNMYTAGGLIGELRGGKCIIRNVEFSNNPNTSSSSNSIYATNSAYDMGTVIGKATVYNAEGGESIYSMVELQGSIIVGKTPTRVGGLIIGENDHALIYLSEINGMVNDQTSQININVQNTVDWNEIGGMGGGLYRNQAISGGNRLIGDGTLQKVGEINHTVAKTDGSYQLTCAADFVCMAIAIWSEGVHATEAFGTGITVENLLSASYIVNPSSQDKIIDISYNKTGIITLNRNDKTSSSASVAIPYAFSGSMKGASDSEGNPITGITIHQDIAVYQNYMGLFSSLTGTNEFSNLTFTGTISNTKYVGGIAYKTFGTGLTLNNITMKKTFNTQSASYVAGVLVEESSSDTFYLNVNDLTLTNSITAQTSSCSGFINNVDKAQISLTNVILGGKIANTYASGSMSYAIGGFLGRTWTNIAGKISNVTVLPDTVFESKGVFGCMLSRVTTTNTGRIVLDKIKLENLTVNVVQQQNFCSLLINDATSLVAEIIDYDSTGCVVNNPGLYFDEVAGKTRNDTTKYPVSYTGIVSLHKSGYTFPEYHYENKVSSLADKTNEYSVYFYDVFQHLENEDGTVKSPMTKDNIPNDSSSYFIIDSPEKLLLCDIMQMTSNFNYFKRYLHMDYQNYYNTTTMYCAVKGELDLSHISFYPIARMKTISFKGIPDDSGNPAKIIFASKQTDALGKVTDMGAWAMSNKNMQSQHYAMHSGLFYNENVNKDFKVIVDNITLSGTIALLGNVSDGYQSGAIVVGPYGLTNGGNFTNITLDNLWIADYNKECADTNAPALLISKIPDRKSGLNEVSFDGIRMENYFASEADKNSTKKAAAALIGSAGGTGYSNVVLNFTHMKIADDKDDDIVNNHNGDVMAYASFIYYYTYADDASLNKSSAIYLFSNGDNEQGNVTYGSEIDENTEFSDTSDKVFEPYSDTALVYKPYVYKVKPILVNPKTGDILKGCGTYDDPYLIEDYRQLLTLYRYINETGTSGSYAYEKFYAVGDGWKIVKPGDDENICDNDHNIKWDMSQKSFYIEDAEGNRTDTSEAVRFTGTGTDFPTPEQLSRAYYRLEADINLSNITDATYSAIAQEFVGFGTSTRPFVGVWYGKGTDGIIHTITLPSMEKVTVYQNYGFIQYAKGAVVKDLIIKTRFSGNETIDTMGTVRVETSSGGVIGTILGGDNIIDNVTVGAHLMVASKYASIGGYVGNVKKGGLILRNVDSTEENGSLKDFRLDQTQSIEGYAFLGAFVGKVEDGFVVYEADEASEQYFWTGTGYNTNYPAIPNYKIFNATKLKNESLGINPVTNQTEAAALNVTLSDNTKTGTDNYVFREVTINIPNAAALQVMSMAMNADALNVQPAITGMGYILCGYTEKSRSRKAKYSDIGCDSITQDYEKAAKYDNVMGYTDSDKAFAYPYLYDYMGIEDEDYKTFCINNNGRIYSVLNSPYYYSNKTCYYAIWKLVADKEYDMSVFDINFRGIGALYQNGAGYGGTFRGDFDGQNSTVRLDMTRLIYGADYQNTSVLSAGLFNTIYYMSYNKYLTIEDRVRDFSYDGEATAQTAYCYEIKNLTVTGDIGISITPYTVAGADYRTDIGGVVGCIQSSRIAFSNINVRNLTIGNEYNNYVDCTGGIVGQSNSGYVMFEKCYIGTAIDDENTQSQEHDIVLKGAGSAGGLIGRKQNERMKITDSMVSNIILDLKYGTNNTSIGECAGGFAGFCSCTTVIEGSDINKLVVTDSTLSAQYSGGFVGRSNSNLYVSNGKAKRLRIGSHANVQYAGGIIGYVYTHSISSVECTELTLRSYYYAGGVMAYAYYNCTSTLNDIKVTDIDISGAENNNTFKGPQAVGGIAGYSGQKHTFNNVTVMGTAAEEGKYNCKITAGPTTTSQTVGGMIGIKGTNTLTMSNCTVDNVYIGKCENATYSNYKFTAGGIIAESGVSVYLGGEISARNLQVVTPMVDKSNSTAGGCFGLTSGAITALTTEPTQYYTGIVSYNNTVISEYASGGIIGHNNGANIRFRAVNVTDGIVISDDASGGMVGYMTPNSGNGSAINHYKETDEATVNLISGMTIKGKNAGGLFGYVYVQGPLRVENISVTGNEIIANRCGGDACSAGGLVGACSVLKDRYFSIYCLNIVNNTISAEVAAETLDSKKEVDKVSAGGVIGRTVNNSNVNAVLRIDNVLVKDDNNIGIRVENTKDIRLIEQVKDDDGKMLQYKLSNVELPLVSDCSKDYEAIEELEQRYGVGVGSFIGLMATPYITIYILCSDDRDRCFDTPVMNNQNPPVVDVGRLSTNTTDFYRQSCHIIYGARRYESDGTLTGKTDVSGVAAKNLEDMHEEYTKISSAYEGTETLQQLLKEIRVPKEALEAFERAYSDSYTIPGTDYTMNQPVLIYRVQDGDLQTVMEYLTDVMTNMAGIPSTQAGILKVEVNPKLCNGTQIISGSTNSISAAVSDTDKKVIYTMNSYDGLDETAGKISYTEITYNYVWSDDSGEHKKVFRINVFVEEPILYSVHSVIMAGKLGDAAAIRENGVKETEADLVMAVDSDYTMLLEYTYGKARKDMAEGVTTDKVFYTQMNGEDTMLTLGTQFLLVDVTHGNKAYYYTVTEEDVRNNKSAVRFTDFIDAYGNSYKNYSIKALEDETDENQSYYTDLSGHQLQEVGVERYLLTVLGNSNAPDRNFSIHTGLYVEDENLESKFMLEEEHISESKWGVRAIQGLSVTLVEKGDNHSTDIYGKISKSEGLNIKAKFALTAPDIYWTELETGQLMDSANNGKYIDLAFYLRDKKSNRVNLPTGTQFRYVVDSIDYSSSILDASSLYYYKDIETELQKEDVNKFFHYLIENIKKNTNVSVEFSLDFAQADLSDITDSVYEAWIELLRTANKEYPMGSGNKVDFYSEDVQASGTNELGFAFKADDINQLAINTYPVANDNDIITAKVMFDFSEIMKNAELGSGEDVVAEKWADYDYVVDYQIYRKVKVSDEQDAVSYIYQPYEGRVSDGNIYYDIQLGATGGTVSDATDGKLQMVYKFTQQQITSGQVISYPCTVTLNTLNLISDLDNLANYEVKATLKIRDKDVVSDDESNDTDENDNSSYSYVKTTEDFFIYTVTRLKYGF